MGELRKLREDPNGLDHGLWVLLACIIIGFAIGVLVMRLLS